MSMQVPGGVGASYAGQRQEISGALTGVVVRYVRKLAGDEGVARMLALAGEARTPGQLEDVTSWSSHEQAIALLEAAGQVLGDPDVGRRVGEEMLRQHEGTEVGNLLRSLGSPGELLRNVAAAAAKFSTVATMEPLEVGDAHAVVRSYTHPPYLRHLQFCEFTKGLLSQVPVLFGLVPAVVAESECQARGGRFCLYSVAWEAHQWSSFVDERTSLYTVAWNEEGVMEAQSELDEATRVAQLERQCAQLSERLQDVYSTAADLLSTDELGGVLARITSRAASAVNAPRYLFVAQTRPDAPYQIHHRGFSEEQARALAAELLEEQPDDHGGSWLIADVESPRHRYGRLAAIYPHSNAFFAQEHEILSVFAKYAATALDIVATLEETRRSNATTTALLEFARALSQMTTVEDVAQELATTVPKVVACDRASVLIREPDGDRLVLRARSDQLIGKGTEAADGRAAGDLSTTGGTAPAAGEGVTGSDVAAGEGVTGSDVAAGEGLVVIERRDSPAFGQLVDRHERLFVDRDTSDGLARELLERAGMRAAMLVPLVSSGETLGVLAVSSASRSAAELAADQELTERVMGLADQAATALQNTRLLEKVSHMAWHDALTGLPNRRLLEDRVTQELNRSKRTGEPVCMFFVDLDRFKQVNDTLGHAAGDELIQQVAKRLCDTVRRQDTVARLGGDEFAVLLPGLSDPAAIEQLAKRVLDALNRPYRIAGQEVYTSASIGVAIAPLHGETYDELLTNADAAMYRSKGLGRNTYQVFEAVPGERRAVNVQLESELHHAVERGELFVLYQPFIDLETARIVGVEALARWRHPTRGVLEPHAFIPLAEESDLIVTIDTWVMRQALRQLRSWLDRGLPRIRVSVNVATRDLVSDAFVEAVEQELAATGLDAELLELEVTERVVALDNEPLRRNVARLEAAGVRFSVDDFGSGNSSLSRIGTFPVSTLKIDQSFVQVLGPKEEAAAIVSAIVSMAEQLGVECVAEGVETSQQSRVLLQRGCTTAQGFFFSPPLLPGDVERLLADAGSGSDRTIPPSALGDG
jgi:diguanylate cyclase (GGDEF)-like protein